MSAEDPSVTQASSQAPPAGAAAAAPKVQTTINVAVNQGTVIGTQIINQAKAAPALHQLRAPVGDFVGRADEIGQLVQALGTAAGTGAAAIGCVRGMAGVGKTELAYTVAQQLSASFPDAQLLVDLRGVSPTPLPPAQALQAIIHSFDREAKLPDDVDELAGLYAAALAGKRALILADDAQDAAQVRALLAPPGCALLITSRNRFALPAMRAIDLDTLPPPAAAQLLLAICPRIGADADALAKECGYLPLALRISAGLLATNDTRPVASCLARVGAARLSYLSDPDDPTASVETSLRLSYDDLTPDGQAALGQLSVFPTSFDAPAAQAVVAVAGDAGEALELLRRTSLLEWDAALERYNLQDLVRVFGAARLDAADAAWLRHAQHYLQVAASVQDLYGKDQQLAGLALFDRERVQIDAGWLWAREHANTPDADELQLGYVRATADISLLRYNARTECIPQQEACLAAAQRLGRKDAECAVLGNLGNAYANLGDISKAIDYYEQSLAIVREIGDRHGEASALGNLGSAYGALGDLPKAIKHQEQALAIVREIGDRRAEAITLGNLGNAYGGLGDAAKAITYQEQALAILREIGDRGSQASTLGSIGLSYGALGDVAKAATYFDQQLAIAREIGDRRGEGRALDNLGLAHANLGDAPKAIEYQEQALAIVREVGDRRGEGRSLGNLGLAYAASGDASKAIDYYEQSLAIARDVGDKQAEGYLLGNLGDAYAELGDAAKTIEAYQQQLAMKSELGDQRGVAFASWSLGSVLAAQGDLARAAELIQMCVTLEQALNDPIAAEHAAQLAQLRKQLTRGAAGKAGDGKQKPAGPKKQLRQRLASGAGADKPAEAPAADKAKGKGSKPKAQGPAKDGG